MVTVKKFTSIDEFLKAYNDEPESFNMLVPVQSIQEISQIYKPVINLILISIDLEENQIYVQKNAKTPDGENYKETRYSISRRGLMLLSMAADCHFIDSNSYYNPDTDSFTCVANMKMHDMSGGWRVITESKSVPKMKTYTNGNKKLDSEAPQKAESGAQNRCIRSGLNIKQHYSLEQLKLPFVAIYPVLDARDEDVKRAMIAGAVASQNLLFGTPRQMARLAAPAGVDTFTGEIRDTGKAAEQAPPQNIGEQAEKFYCSVESCKTEIGKAVAEYSMKNYGAQLCTKCQKAAKAAQAAGKQGGTKQ